MTNEVSELEVGVQFKPSEIKITNKEILEKAVIEYSKKYTGLVISQDTLQTAKKTRAEMRKVIANLDDKRKGIKKSYSAPLKDFETEIKGLTIKLDAAIVPIDTGIKELEQREADERLQAVTDLIAEMAPNYGLTPEEFPVDPSLLLKSTSKVKRTEMISQSMTLMQANKERLAADVQSITKYANAVGMEPDGWVNMVSAGKPLVNVMRDIDNAVENRKKQAEKAKHQEEYLAAIAELKKEQVGDKEVDTETGEVLNTNPEPKLMEFNLKVQGTFEQLRDLNNYMTTAGIKFTKIG